MKRWLVVAILVAALVTVVSGTALAQSTAPATGTWPCGLTPATGVRGSMMGGGMLGGMRGMPAWAGLSESVETLLGMTAAEIQTERQAGKSLVEIAASKNVTEDALIQAILDDHKADLAQLVADGKLTQAQADAMIARMQEQVKVMVERTGVGPMMGQGQQNVPPAGSRGRGGMRGGGMFGGVQG
jgi:hypothetical protein